MLARQLQDEISAWHREKFPSATAKDVALKLAEETGEVCRAVVEQEHPSLHRATTSNLEDELGDVVLCCLALAEKIGLDLEYIVRFRWEAVRHR